MKRVLNQLESLFADLSHLDEKRFLHLISPNPPIAVPFVKYMMIIRWDNVYIQDICEIAHTYRNFFFHDIISELTIYIE